jgi:copper chaperone
MRQRFKENPMLAFQVNDMTCGHCISTLTKALKAADRDAQVTIDLRQRLVMIEPTEADAQELSAAIAEAGYTPVPVQAAMVIAEPTPTRPGGCCGCR